MKFILFIFILILIFLNCIKLKERFSNEIPNFNLYDTNNKLIDSKNWEYKEQELLQKYLKKGDRILQLGANIGTSCIVADKLLNSEKDSVYCVEPNKNIIEILEKNKKLNNSNFNIINGILTETNNNKLDTRHDYPNKASAKISKDGDMEINSLSLKNLKIDFNVLFADCEGCLEKFIDEYEDIVKHLRLVIFEMDYKNECNYDKIKSILEKHNFTKDFDDNYLCVYIKK